jgi:membrane protease YdiL (CAAX protease family)
MPNYQSLFSSLRLRWLILLWYGTFSGAYLLMALVRFYTPTDFWSPESLSFYEAFPNFLGQITLIGMLWAICRRKGFSLSDFWPKPASPKSWYWLLLLFLPLLLVTIATNFALAYFFEWLMTYRDSFSQTQTILDLNPSGSWILHASKSYWFQAYNFVSVFGTVVLAPCLEELFFRGIALHRLSVKYGSYKGLWLSAMLFGIFHLQGFIDATLFGLVLGFVYMQTRSLKITICWHILHNAVFTLIAIIVSQSEVLTNMWVEGIINAISIGLLFAFLLFLPKGIRWVSHQPIYYTAPLFREKENPCGEME